MSELPERISNLTNLQKLYIQNNQLTRLPLRIGNLTNLKVLDIKNNQLTQIPESISNLTNLETLVLTNNPNLFIPDWLRQMNIRFIHYDVNNVDVNPFEVHDVFNKISDEQVDELNTFLSSKIATGIDGTMDIKTFIKTKIDALIDELSDQNLPEKPEGYYTNEDGTSVSNLREAWDVLYAERIEGLHPNLGLKDPQLLMLRLILLYVEQQPENFRNQYVKSFLEDSTCAYEYNRFKENLSCAKGVIERIILSLRGTITITDANSTLTKKNKEDYTIIENLLIGAFDEEKVKELIQEWIKGNKQAIKSNNRDALFIYLRSNLQDVRVEQLMSNKIIKETIDYIFDGNYSPENVAVKNKPSVPSGKAENRNGARKINTLRLRKKKQNLLQKKRSNKKKKGLTRKKKGSTKKRKV